jgi:2-polyprenyl-3-methyl-5-hydroxy-6-metoxy-1,4-benzoquinol methylase
MNPLSESASPVGSNTPVSVRTRSLPKKLLDGMFARLGLRISRIPRPRGGELYFNTGRLTPAEENSRELYEQFYGDHTALNDYYTEHRLAFYRAVSDRLQEINLAVDGKDLLDVGCGTGHLLTELRRWSKPRSMTGCDFSEQATRFSREHFPGCRFFTHDIYEPLLESFDVVLCTEVLEHLEQPFVAIRNLLNATRPRGALVLTVPNGRMDTANEHLNFWSPESWKVFLERECARCVVKTSTFLDGKNNFALVQKPPGKPG